jgi:hypothetical protein
MAVLENEGGAVLMKTRWKHDTRYEVEGGKK